MTVGTSRWRDERPDGVALADERCELTWSEVDARLDQVAGALDGLELGEHRRVAIFGENSVETALVYLAALFADVSTVPISYLLTASEVTYILEDSGASALFVGPETAALGATAAAAAGVGTVIAWRQADAGNSLVDFDAWAGAAPAVEPPADRAFRPHLHYTSGTTGRPKGTETPPAMLPGGETIGEHVDNLRAVPMFSSGGASLVVGPLYHTGPLCSLRGLFAGIGQIVHSRFDPERALAAIEQYRVTTSVMVPTHFQRFLALPEDTRSRYDLSSLSFVGHTGAACPRDVKRRMIEWWGPVLIEAYGSTESGSTNAISSQEWLEHPGSVGRTIPPFEVVVVDDDGNEVPAGTPGRLYFRDTTGRGIVYHNDPEKTAAAHIAPGVFTLGEVGYVADAGYVFITDRTSDMIVSGGVNVYPAEAEMVLIDHPGVADVACVGIPHEDLGEQLLAIVVPVDPETPPSERELIELCRGRIAHYKAPTSVAFLDDLGRNPMGKLNKRALRAPYWPTDRTIGG